MPGAARPARATGRNHIPVAIRLTRVTIIRARHFARAREQPAFLDPVPISRSIHRQAREERRHQRRRLTRRRRGRHGKQLPFSVSTPSR